MCKKKVLLVLNSFVVGGAERVVLDTLLAFKNDEEYELMAVTWDGQCHSAFEEAIKENGLRVHYLDVPHSTKKNVIVRKLDNLYKTVKPLEAVLKEYHPDILHVHMTHNLKYTILPVLKYHVKGRFVTMHANPYTITNFDAFFMKVAVKWAKYTPVCLNETQAFLAMKRYHIPKPVIVHNSLNMARFRDANDVLEDGTTIRKQLGIAENAFVIGFVGRLDRVKNLEFSLQVMKEVFQKKEDTVYVLVGGGEEKEALQQVAVELHIDKRVIFAGERLDVEKCYHAFDVFLLTSESEAHPMAAMEAQSSDLRCVFSEAVPIDAIFADKVTRMSLSESVECWADVILNGNRFVTPLAREEEFSAQFCKERLKSIYEEQLHGIGH